MLAVVRSAAVAPVTLITWGFLDYQLPYSPLWDLVRSVVIFMAFFIIWSMVMYFRDTQAHERDRILLYTTIINSLIQVFFILTLLDALGEDVPWYRMPMMLLIDGLIMYNIRQSQRERGVR